MTHADFDEADWIRRLGTALEDVAANATPRYSPIPAMPTGIRPIEEFDSALRLGYRHLAERAKHDRTAWKQFNKSHLEVRTDPAEARAILREHALMKPWLVGSGKDEAVVGWILNSGYRAELAGLVNCLAKLSVKEGGEEAARQLHEFLTASANARIPADEIIVVHGVMVAGRVNLASGAYLAPYEDAKMEFDLPDEPEPFQEKPTPNAAVLVRSLEFGPGIGPAEEKRGLPDTQVRYRFPTDYRIDLERWFEDGKFLVDVLSIAVQAPLLSHTRYVRLPKWIQEIERNFAHGIQDSGGFVSDAWPSGKGRELSKTGAEAFVALAHDWYTEPEKPRAWALAMRRLAGSLSRLGGRFGEEDRILDIAITLEICYGGKTGHELAKRAARLLGAGATEQIRTYDQARQFYRVRSRIVHTEEPVPARGSLYRELEAGQDLACRSLRSLLKCDMPVNWAQVRPHLEREAEEYIERAKPTSGTHQRTNARPPGKSEPRLGNESSFGSAGPA